MGVAKYSYNSNFFKNSSRERSYILGLLYTDGNILEKDYQTTIVLQKQDISILEKIRDIVCPDKLIYKCKTGFKLLFNNKIIYYDLLQLGLYPNKSNTLKVHLDFIHDIDFWRGCIDGDGWVYYKNNTLILGFCGTINMVNSFKDFCTSYTNTKCNVYIDKRLKNKGNFAKFQISGKDANKICEILYNNTELYIDRKYKNWVNYCDFIINYNPWKLKPVAQYDLEGNFIKKWDSKSEVKNFYGMSDILIFSKSKTSCYGYFWENIYETQEIPLKIKIPENYKFKQIKV